MRAGKAVAGALASALVVGWALRAPAQEAGAEAEDPARAIVLRMAEHLARAPHFSVTQETAYDAIQPDGQRIEFGAMRRVAVRRPQHMRIDTVHRDGSRRGLLFDGKQISVFDLDEKVYASVEKKGTLDQLVDYLQDELDTPVPLSELYTSDLPQSVAQRMRDALYVGEETLDGVACDHVAVRAEEVDYQMWVERGEAPLLHRIVITYKEAPGQPQFRAELSGWSFAEIPDAIFAFAPAEGSEKIPFAARSRPAGVEAPAAESR